MNNDNKKLIGENLALVHACAKKFKNKGIEYDDLFQSGCIGIVKAAEKFDKTKGVKFSTYAVTVILGEIKNLFRTGGSVKVSRNLKELYAMINKESDKFYIENSRVPTVEELSKILKKDVSDIAMALDSARIPISLSVADEQENCKEMEIPAEENENITEQIALKQLLYNMAKEERSIIILRFFQDYTQSQTGEILGMSQVQVSRKEKKILTKLKDELEQ